jgi:hypothetical protein
LPICGTSKSKIYGIYYEQIISDNILGNDYLKNLKNLKNLKSFPKNTIL